MSVQHAMEKVQMEEEIASLRRSVTHLKTFLTNICTSLEEGDDPLKVADDIHDAMGDGRPNNTEEED